MEEVDDCEIEDVDEGDGVGVLVAETEIDDVGVCEDVGVWDTEIEDVGV